MNTTPDALVSAASLSAPPAHTPISNLRLRVRVNGRDFRLPLSALAGVADCPSLARVPAAPPWLLGVGGLHGRLLPVVDLAAAEGHPSADVTPGPRVLLVEVSGHVIGFSVSDVTVEPETSEPEDQTNLAIHELASRLLKDVLISQSACQTAT